MFWAIDIVVISLLLNILSTASLDSNIKPSGVQFIRALGSSILFTCEANGVGRSTDVKIQWLDKDKREITESTGRRIYVEKGEQLKKLYITSIENNDKGKYTCVVSHGSAKKERIVELVLFKDITFEHVPNPQHPAIYSDALIECRVSGNPPPHVTWRYDGRHLELDGRRVRESNGLRVRNITQIDNGNYTCGAEVESDGRYDEKRITVVVHIPPVVYEGPREEQGIMGEYISITCKATGFPSPKFEFYKDNRGKVLPSGDRVVVDADLGKISFRPLMKEDEGQYTCRAHNDVGNNSKSGRLRVFVPPKIHELKNTTKSELETAVLVCKSDGDPPPNMSFHKEGSFAPYRVGNNDGERIFVKDNKAGHIELHIRKLAPNDAANYTCVSHNSAGRDNKTGVIDVQYKPRFDHDHKKLVYSWAGTRHNMSCHVHAQPMPTIRWVRYGRMLENNDTFHIFNSGKHSNLQVQVQDADQSWIYGDYICRAENSKGRADLNITLARATTPDAPQRVQVKDTSPNQVVFVVDPPRENGGVKVIGYRVEFESYIQDIAVITGTVGPISDMTKESRQASKNDSTELSIDNLRPGTRYVFRIGAKNDVGVGHLVEHIVTTGNLTKPFRIHITSPKQGYNPRQYRLEWQRPRTGGWPIKEYEFRYKKVKSSDEDSKDPKELSDDQWNVEHVQDTFGTPMRSHMISGLTPLTQYQLQVVAKNKLGSSDLVEFFFHTSDVFSRHRFKMDSCCWVPLPYIFYRTGT